MAMTGGNAVLVKSEKGNYGQSSNSINLYVYWKEISQDQKNNSTSLRLGMYVSTPSSYNIGPWGDYNGSYIGTATSGADCKTFDGSIPKFSGTRWLVEDKEITVKHEDDGTKTVTLYWKWGVNSPWGGYEKPSGSLKIDLTPIPRVSAVSAVGGDIGSQLSIKITRENEAFTHSLEYSFGNASGVIAENIDADSVAWTPPMELCREIPNAETGICTVTCKTYSDSELIGTSNCEIVLHVPDNVVLSTELGWINMSPYNEGTAASGMDEFIQGFSKAELTFDTSLLITDNSYGAEPASFKITMGEKSEVIDASETVYRTATITQAGAITLECQVTDTRGRSFSISLFRTVQPYSPPTLSDVEAFRCDINGDPTDTGTYIYVKATPVYSGINGLNDISFKARYKVRGGSFGDAVELTPGEASIIGGGVISASLTYLAEISVIDALGKPAIYTGYIPMDDNFFCGRRGGKGAGFGGYAKRDDLLYVGWDAHIKGDLYMGEDEKQIADFPVLFKTATIDEVVWNYRRWNSGLVEGWAKNVTAPDAGCVYGQIPTSFIEQPEIFVSNTHDGTKPIIVTREILYEDGVYGYNLHLNYLDGQSCSVNPGVDIYVQGRWKQP